MATTPNEFLQFAKEMGLEDIKSTSPSTSLPISNNNGYTLTGLSVLNNLCHLIEDIHRLKAENDRLRAHLELVNHVEKFLLKNDDKKLKKQKEIFHSTLSLRGEGNHEDEKSSTLSPSNSLKTKHRTSSTLSISSRERPGTDFVSTYDDSSSMLQVDQDQSELMYTSGSSASPNWNNWNKVRHGLKFSLGRKQASPNYPLLTQTDRQIPAISISFESDDDHVQENKMKRNTLITNSYRRSLTWEDTDQDDESTRIIEKRESHGDVSINLLNNERPELLTPNLPFVSLTVDDDTLLKRKQSKIAHYRRKLRSKLDTVKKQFSDQNTSSSLRLNTHGSIFNDIGSGINHAILTAKLAPAMTKSYQQKMREWQTLQKSTFLVNYRRQSIINKIELNNNPRKASVVSTINETSFEKSTPSEIDKTNIQLERKFSTISPTLSPTQRSLIVHQWREIMSEEISLRHYNEYFRRKMLEIKQLETDLKCLKTSIFCTNNRDYFLKHRSLTNIEQIDDDLLDQHRQAYLPQRSRSYQSLISMPASWILAVQSAAYSDVLDGASKKTTERAIIFNKSFFKQLKHFKDDRLHFQQDTIKDLQALRNSKTNISNETKSRSCLRLRTRPILTRASLRRLSHSSPSVMAQQFVSNPLTPCQTVMSKLDAFYNIDLLSTPATSEIEVSLLASSATLNKRVKRSRFDFKKTLQRSKSMCMTQFNSWLQRRRQQQHPSVPRRKSAIESKTNKQTRASPCTTPKLLGSPRLGRLHQRIFKQHPSSSELPSLPSPISTDIFSLSSPQLDDSDQQFQQRELPVRIYLSARASPPTRHVRITDINNINDKNIKIPPMAKITSPILTRRNLQSLIKQTTIRERRESYASMTNILIDK